MKQKWFSQVGFGWGCYLWIYKASCKKHQSSLWKDSSWTVWSIQACLPGRRAYCDSLPRLCFRTKDQVIVLNEGVRSTPVIWSCSKHKSCHMWQIRTGPSFPSLAEDGRKQKGKSLKRGRESKVRTTTGSLAAMKNKDSQEWGKPCKE